jgi:hypothetical protein
VSALSRDALGCHAWCAAPATAESLRLEGNEAFSSKDFDRAVALYTQALACLEGSEDDAAVIYGNRSLAHLRRKAFDAALDDANAALAIRPVWAKAILRRSQALVELGRFVEAFRTATQALQLTQMGSIDVDSATVRAFEGVCERVRKEVLESFEGLSEDAVDDDAWLSALEMQVNWRVRLASLAHCWNAASGDTRMVVLKEVQRALRGAPLAGTVPLEAMLPAAAERRCAELGRRVESGAPALASLNADEVRDLKHWLTGPASDGPVDPESVGVTAEMLQPFPMANYEDIEPVAKLVRVFVGADLVRQSRLWEGVWRTLALFERCLVAHDFVTFFPSLVSLSPYLQCGVDSITKATSSST